MQRADYGPFDYSPIISRPVLKWPNGARVALWVIPNIEFFSLAERVPQQAGGVSNPVPDVPAWAVRDYGNRVGVFRLMEVMVRHGVRGTVALNSDLCAKHPQILAEARRLDWEFMGHNQSNTWRLNDIKPEAEPDLIRSTLETIETATGTRPRGWLGSGLAETWNTVDLLAENGCLYVADWVNDDQPYLMNLEKDRRLVSVPYSLELNDKPAFEKFHRTADEFREMICRQFDTLYREGEKSGRVMAIALHPYIIGMPHRIGALDAALAYIKGHSDVWCATGGEIARHYLQINQPKSPG